jgi:hypothetical protein
MSKFFNISAKTLISASLIIGLISPNAFAGIKVGPRSTMSANSQSAIAYSICAAPKVIVNVCSEFGPAAPGELFGSCLRYQPQCQGPAYTGK